MNYTSNHLAVPLNDDQVIIQDADQTFMGTTFNSTSYTETQTNYAASFGLKAKYACFSGSLKAAVSNQTFQSVTTYNFGYSAVIDCGTTSFYQRDDSATIRKCLDPALISALDNITTMAMASDFISTYGTHVITSVAMGGALYISVTATTQSAAELTSLSASVSAQYKSVNSMKMTGSATASLESDNSDYNYSSVISTLGGSAVVASAVDPTNPGSFTAWADTCDDGYVSGVADTIEFASLTNETASEMLNNYCNASILAQSLNYPSYFLGSSPCVNNSGSQADAETPPGYKIIGGGARVVESSNQNFLTSTYPVWDGSEITAWTARSHDMAYANPTSPANGAQPGDMLYSFAVAAYDPGNLLTVSCVSTPGSNSGNGRDQAAATPSGTLVGGGASAICTSGNPKFIYASFPSTNSEWTGVVLDFQKPATDVPLVVYGIGIQAKYVDIAVAIRDQEEQVEAGDCELSQSMPQSVSGGGIRIEINQGIGRPAIASAPTAATVWYTQSCDWNTPSSGSQWAYAMGIVAKLSEEEEG